MLCSHLKIRFIWNNKLTLQTGNQNWRIGITSILASAVGLAPFKDVFWSSHIETGNPYGPKAIEPYPELEVAIATLSTGPVGPGDKIGLANGTIIMRLVA